MMRLVERKREREREREGAGGWGECVCQAEKGREEVQAQERGEKTGEEDARRPRPTTRPRRRHGTTNVSLELKALPSVLALFISKIWNLFYAGIELAPLSIASPDITPVSSCRYKSCLAYAGISMQNLLSLRPCQKQAPLSHISEPRYRAYSYSPCSIDIAHAHSGQNLPCTNPGIPWQRYTNAAS
jgi:hypothetical protein